MSTAAQGKEHTSGKKIGVILFCCCLIFCLTPWSSPGISLALGLGIALTLGNPLPKVTQKVSKPLLQISVILLGFGMNLYVMLGAAKEGFWLAAATILMTFTIGYVLHKLLKIEKSTSTLLSAGTAICGGSAIAAVALAIAAAEAEISVALGTVFMLNAVALYIFPMLGHAMDLSQAQFGTWSGIAIHDVSSVVGAASSYGQVALQTATAVKLSRTLWIIPVALLAGMAFKKNTDDNRAANLNGAPVKKSLFSRITIPWFIAFFVLASCLRTFVPGIELISGNIVTLARVGMTITLFLIGVTLSRAAIKSVGVKAVLQGVTLWLAISTVSLLVIRMRASAH